MAFSEEYKNTVINRLSKVCPVYAKNMFGGVGIYAENHFFAVIADDRLYFKTDDTNVADYKKFDMPAWEISRSYYALPASVFEDISELKVWVDKAVGVAARKKQRKLSKR